MKRLLLLVVLSIAGCAMPIERQVTEIKPVKLNQVDINSTTHGYIAASAFYQFIIYDNMGGIEENYIAPMPKHCNMFRPDVKCPVTRNAFAPVNSPTTSYDLVFDGFAINTLYFFEVPTGQYHKVSDWAGRYEGPLFEINPGQILYYGHYQKQYDLERNIVFGDHYENICQGVANKLDDAKPKLNKIKSNLKFDESLIPTFKMDYFNDGRNPCTVQRIN